MRYLLTFLSVFTLSGAALAQNSDNLELPNLTTLPSMNGIDPAPYDKFWENWPLVTTRYRADNGEQRFIYANDIAIKAMQEGALVFPDGAVFAKIGFAAEEDVHFPNSYEPVNYVRMQIMVKDSEKFKDMNGWSYWLHVDGVKDNPKEHKQNAIVCHACHTIVKDRDYVFASPTFMGKMGKLYGSIGKKYEDAFEPRPISQLSDFEREILKHLPQKPKQVNTLRMRLFSGSLYESIGPLAKFTKDKSTYLLFDPAGKRFLAAQPLKPTKKCQDRALVLMELRKTKTKGGKKEKVKYLRKGIVCNGENTWVKNTPMPKTMLAKE